MSPPFQFNLSLPKFIALDLSASLIVPSIFSTFLFYHTPSKVVLSHLIFSKLKTVLTNRILRFLQDRLRKEPESYDQFFEHYGIFLKDGILDAMTGQNDKVLKYILSIVHYIEPIQFTLLNLFF